MTAWAGYLAGALVPESNEGKRAWVRSSGSRCLREGFRRTDQPMPCRTRGTVLENEPVPRMDDLECQLDMGVSASWTSISL